MAVSSIGVGSGLPLEELLANLRNSENNALVLIQSKQINAEQRLSAYGTLKSALEELNKAGQALGKVETMGALKTSVAGDSFTANATSSAIPGKYNVVVKQLATSQSLVAAGQADRKAAIGAGGVITFKSADPDAEPKTLDLTGKGTSLNDIVAAINGDPKLGVNATVINNGDTFQLVLTTTATGEKAALTEISVAGNAELDAIMGFGASAPAGSMQLTGPAAKNAIISVNGIEVESQTNTIENVLDGVTLTLNKADAADATGNALSIIRDEAGAAKAINAFVTAYNSLQGTIKTLTSYNADAQQSSALTGDSLARQMQNQVRSVLNVSGASGDIRSLAQLGISTDPATGLLKVDNDKLNAAVKNNLGDVQNLLGGENGLSKKLADVTATFNKSGGLISAAQDGATKSAAELKKQFDATSERIETKMANYRAQFTALDSLVAQMNSTSTYLTQQLSMLGNMNEK